MSPTCPECGEEIDCDDCEGGDNLEWVPKAFKENEEAILKPFKELVNQWHQDKSNWRTQLHLCADELDALIKSVEAKE